jgi:hypothetical protein
MELETVLIIIVLLEAVGIMGLLLNNRDLKGEIAKLQTWNALKESTPGKYVKGRTVKR